MKRVQNTAVVCKAKRISRGVKKKIISVNFLVPNIKYVEVIL